MKLATVGSLDSVEALLALEEELEGPLTNRIPAIKSYLVAPFAAQCTNGGTVIHVWIVARHGSAVLFASFKTASFGVGVLADVAQVRESHHYPTIDMAAYSFLGAVKVAA